MITLFFKTYGCQANVADSEGLITYLESLGCATVATEREADLIIVNTCAIREKAEQKMFSYIGALADYKRERSYLRIGVIGCVASYRKKEIYDRFDHVNFVVGARDDISSFQGYLFDVVTKLESIKQLYESDQPLSETSKQDRNLSLPQAIETPSSQTEKHREQTVYRGALSLQKGKTKVTDLPKAGLGGGVRERAQHYKRSFVNITSGCNNYCTFCIVPFTRGRERSYSLSSIIAHVEKNVAAGAQEITLVGQNVNSYQCPDTKARFAVLLEQVAQIPGDFWVRYISPHPKDMTNDVIETMALYKDKLCSWIHFPLQSGSDRILKAMNRTYTASLYLEKVDVMRDLIPDVVISTDIIVGFPGETESDYQATRTVMEKVKFDFTFSFIYSKRKYTKAYRMEDPCPENVKAERLEALQKRQKEICLEKNQQRIGLQERVLIEKQLDDGKLLARTSGNIRVLLTGSPDMIGSFATVSIEHAGIVNLSGKII